MAMYMAAHGHIPSKIWKHNPTKKDAYGNTVAMLLAKNGIIPPDEWHYKETKEPYIAMILFNKGITLSKNNIWYKYITKIQDEDEDKIIDNIIEL